MNEKDNQIALDLLNMGPKRFLAIMSAVIDYDVSRTLSIPDLITKKLNALWSVERVKVRDFAHHTHAAMSGMLKDPALKARAIRDVIMSGQFHTAPVEKELKEKYSELIKDPKTLEYLTNFPYGGSND